MVAMKYAAALLACVAAAAIAAPSHASTVDSHIPACAGSNAGAIDMTTKIHLLCDDAGAVQGDTGAKRYVCKPEGEVNTFVADVVVKKTDANKTSQVQSIIFDNAAAGNKVYTISSGITDGKKTFYWALQGQEVTCSVTGSFASQIGGFDPTSLYVYDQIKDGSHP